MRARSVVAAAALAATAVLGGAAAASADTDPVDAPGTAALGAGDDGAKGSSDSLFGTNPDLASGVNVLNGGALGQTSKALLGD